MSNQEFTYFPAAKARTRSAGGRNSGKAKDRKLTVSYTYFKEKAVPSIRLSGNWLARIGFNLGQKVIVRGEQPGELVIQLAEEATV